MKIEERGNEGVIFDDNNVYTFEITNKTRSEVEESVSQNRTGWDWEDHKLTVGNYRVLPYGIKNDLPREIREGIKNNHLAPRIFTKRLFLTWGQGPFLYSLEANEKGTIIKKPVTDPEVMAWLNANNYRKQLRSAIVDYNHGEQVVHKIVRNRGPRIGGPARVAKIEHIPADKLRVGYPIDKDKFGEEVTPTHALIGRWNKYLTSKYKAYPLIGPESIVEFEVAIMQSYLNAYATRYYPYPDVVSALPWIKRSSAIPFILETLVKNNLTIRWHIIVPERYWTAQKEYLMMREEKEQRPWKEKVFQDFKDRKLRQVASLLSGAENTGKFIATESIIESIDGRAPVEHKWEFIPVDQKIKDFVEANLEISKRADFNTVSGLGLHAALSNVSAEGKSDSGSEQLYALRNFLLTEVDLPEEIICEAWNRSIEQNWPGRNIRLGFYRQLPIREEDVTPKSRINA